jgi:hypothetical protein
LAEVVSVEVGTIVHVPAVPRFKGPSTSKSHVDFPDTEGLIENERTLPPKRPKPRADIAPLVIAMGIVTPKQT